MNIFKKISNVKYYIKYLTAQSQRITDRDKLKNHIKMVNAIILLVNDIEFMLETNISTSVMERIILARFYSEIIKYNDRSEPVPVQYIFDKIMMELQLSPEDHKNNIIEFLNDKHLLNVLNQMPKVQTNNFIIDSEITDPGQRKLLNQVYNEKIDMANVTDMEVNDISEQIINGPTDTVYKTLLNELLERFKWNVNIIYQN